MRNLQQRLFDAYAGEVKRVAGNDDGIITAAQGDIDTPTDGFADNSRLCLPPTAFNRFAVTREINGGLLAPRFAPSQRAWVLSGVRVPVSPVVDASTGVTPTIADVWHREEAAGRPPSRFANTNQNRLSNRTE